MKPHLITLLLILTLPFTLHAAPEYTITNKNRVIQEVSLNPNRVAIGTQLSHLNFTTLSGDTRDLDTLTQQGPIVFVFLATECPVAQRYAMRLKRLHTEFTGEKYTTLVAVYANENDTVNDIEAYVAKAAYTFPVVKDTTGRLARALGATMTPQAVVIDTTRTLRYRGPIDDNRYETRVKHRYLHDALLATHTGAPVSVEETPAFGCTLHLSEAKFPTQLTYSEHIAPMTPKELPDMSPSRRGRAVHTCHLRGREGLGNRDR